MNVDYWLPVNGGASGDSAFQEETRAGVNTRPGHLCAAIPKRFRSLHASGKCVDGDADNGRSRVIWRRA